MSSSGDNRKTTQQATMSVVQIVLLYVKQVLIQPGDPPKGILGLQNHEYHVIAVLLFKWNDPHDNLHEISTSKILNDDSYEIPRITVSSQCIKNGASRSLRRKLHTGSRVLQGPHIRSKTNGTDAKDDCGIHHGTRSFHTEFKTIIIRTGIVVKKSYDS